jgi:polysaccharide pyruvyl transferase WcaK-like protein
VSDPSAPPTIVHIGAFDLASYGDQIFPLVAAHELRSRLGDVTVLPFTPLGSVGSGTGTWALGPWSTERAAAVAGRASLVLCGGGEIVHGDGGVYAPFYGIDPDDAATLQVDRWFLEVLGPAEARCPVVWHGAGVPADLDDRTAARIRAAVANRAVVTVRDEASRRRLAAAGVERQVDVVPDSALLLPRVLPPDRLASWRERLRAEGRYPDRGPVVVVQGNHTMSGYAAGVAGALRAGLPDAQVVTVAVSPCHDDGTYATNVVRALDGPSWTIPEDAPFEAVAAAIAGADCFLGVSLHGAITARAYGRPHVTFDPFAQAKLAGFLEMVGDPDARATDAEGAVAAVRARLGTDVAGVAELEARLDAHFDRIADLARQSAATRAVDPVTWADSPSTLHLTLRRPPRPVAPIGGVDVAGLRRPDIEPSHDDLVATVEVALAARRSQRESAAADHAELVSLRAENGDLRGAIAHLEGTQARADELEATLATRDDQFDAIVADRARLAAAVDGARASRIYRLTGRPAALRLADDAAADADGG